MAKPVKWAIGNSEPEDLEDFKTNEEIGKPPKGVYNFVLNRIQVKKNKNGDDMLMIWAVIKDDLKDKGKWNGYLITSNQNITEQGAPYLKRFLAALGLSWNDFISKTTMDDSVEPPEIVKMGSLNFKSGKKVRVRAATKDDTQEGYEDRLQITRWLPVEEEDEDSLPEAPEDDTEEPEADEVEVAEDAEEEAEEGEEEPWTEAELKELSLEDLKAEAAAMGIEQAAKLKRASTIIKLVLEAQESAEEADPEADPEPEPEPDPEPEAEAEVDLDSLDHDALVAMATEKGASPREIKKAGDDDGLRELIEELLEEDDKPPF